MWNGKRYEVEKQDTGRERGNEPKRRNEGTGRRDETTGRNEGGKQDGNDGADENENIDNGITNVRE